MDTSAPPASPPSRKEGGKSKDCPFSGRSERAKNEATAGEENPITAGASKKGRRRRSSIGQGQYSEALDGASQGLGALRAGDHALSDEDVPPAPPLLADARRAAQSAIEVFGAIWAARRASGPLLASRVISSHI